MSNLRVLLLTFLSLMFSFCAYAYDYDFEVNNIYYKIISQAQAKVAVMKGEKYYEGAIVLPDSVTYRNKRYRVDTVWESAFEFNRKITSLDIGGVRCIEKKAFSQCSALEEVIMRRVETIEIWAFLDCTSLRHLDLGTTRNIGTGVFLGCYNLENLNLKNVETVGDNAFCGCSKLTTLDLRHVKKIEGSPFGEPVGAFSNCASLTSVNLRNVTDVEYLAFSGCKNLKFVETEETTPPSLIKDAFDEITYLDATLIVPAGTKSAYMNDYIWSNFSHIIERGPNANDCYLHLECNRGGSVKVKGIEYSNEIVTETFAMNKAAEILIQPATGYFLKSVVLDNGKDITDRVKRNVLILVFYGSHSLVVTFEKEPVYLTIQQADNGKMMQLVESPKNYEFIFAAAEGWKVNTVTFDGRDVTSKLDANGRYVTPTITLSAVLNVTYELETPAAIDQVEDDGLSVRAHQGRILVEGAPRGLAVKVYNLSGAVVAETATEGAALGIAAQCNQVYLVKVGTRTFKLTL